MGTNKNIEDNIIEFPSQENKKTKKRAPQKKIVFESDEAHKKVLVWLFCPKCQTLEHTNVRSAAGRHHKCGTFVQEKEFEVDICMEMCLCVMNIDRLYEIKIEKPKELVEHFAGENEMEMIQHLIDEEKKMLESLHSYTDRSFQLRNSKKFFLKMAQYVKNISFFDLHYSEFRFYYFDHVCKHENDKETE